jgi:hypothetical protein
MPVLAASHGHSARRSAGTPPTVRASTTGSTPNGTLSGSGGTSFTMTVPSSTVTGDVGLIVVNISQKIVPTTPSGWTLIGTRYDVGTESGSVVLMCVYTRSMLTSDAGGTVTISLVGATNNSMVGVMAIVEGSSGIGTIAYCTDQFSEGENPFPRNVDFPVVLPGPQDLVLMFGVGHPFSTLGQTQAEIASGGQPAGSTIVQNTSVQNNQDVYSFSCWMLSGSATTFSNPSGAIQAALVSDCNGRIGGAITFSPAGHSVTDRLPTSLMGGTLFGYGESYLTYADFSSDLASSNGQGQNYYHMCESIYFQRLQNRMNAAGWTGGDLYNDFGIGGAWASDTCGFAYGTVEYNTHVGSSLDSNWLVKQAGTWVPITGNGNNTLVMLEMVGDDALGDPGPGATGQSLNGAINATDALVRLLRCSSIVPSTPTGNLVYSSSPAWTEETSFNDVPSNVCYYSLGTASGPQASITITTTAQNVDLIFLALDSTGSGGHPGAGYSVTATGLSTVFGGTDLQMRTSTDAQYNRSPYCPLAVPCYGMPSGTNTITITNTSNNPADYLFFAGYLVQGGNTPPWICINHIPEYIDYANIQAAGATNITLSLIQSYNAALDAVASHFDDRVLVFAPATCIEVGGVVTLNSPERNPVFNFSTMINHLDYIHPWDQGSSFYMHNLASFLSSRIP